MPATDKKKYLPAVLILYFFLTSIYSLSVPLWESPDEPSHYLCIRRFSDGKRFQPPRPSGKMDSVWSEAYLYSLYQRNQPPLYYLLATPVMGVLTARFLPLGDPPGFPPVRRDFQRKGNLFLHPRESVWDLKSNEVRGHLLRFFSVFLGGVAVYLIYLTARLIFPDSPPVALAAAGFAACLPQFNFIMGSISNDTLAVLLGTATLLVMVKLAAPARPARGSDFLLLGTMIALSFSAKFNLLFLIPVSLFLVYFKARDAKSWRTGFLGLIMTLLPVLLLLGLAVLISPRLNPIKLRFLLYRLSRTRPSFLTLNHLETIVVNIYQSFWARFGWMSIKVGPGLYLGWGMLALAGLVGWGRIVKNKELPAGPARRSVGLLALSFLLLLLAVIKNSLLVRQSQGRFLFPVLAPVSLLLALGVLHLFPERFRRRGAFVFLFCLLVLNLISFFGYFLPASYA